MSLLVLGKPKWPTFEMRDINGKAFARLAEVTDEDEKVRQL
jgi:hypothetical protein